MKYISEFKPGEFWESGDRKHWVRLDDKYEKLINRAGDVNKAFEVLAKYIMEHPEIPDWQEPEAVGAGTRRTRPMGSRRRQDKNKFERDWDRDIAAFEEMMSKVPSTGEEK
jgi:hypothetical protein